jgi:hypothetical protein
MNHACPLAVSLALLGLLAPACNDGTDTYVVVDNEYPASASVPSVIYQAYWEATTFQTPIPPGTSSAPETTVTASGNTAYAVLAPGWDPTSGAPPTSFVVLESRSVYSVHLRDTLHIPVDDATFAGNCAAGSFLDTSDANTITTLVFPGIFAGTTYDPATCTTTRTGDGGLAEAGDP